MASKLQADSFSSSNLRERTLLISDVQPNATTITVVSTSGFQVGNFIYVGHLSREGCERAVIAAVTNATTLTLVSPLQNAHSASEPVTAVLGDMIRFYRAANVDGSVPADAAFSVMATRQINADRTSTYYNDSTGGSDWWYKITYFNAVENVETALADAEAVRGSDFGHYCSIPEIRSEAGFDNAYNLKDSTINQQRRAAEAEVNAGLAGAYTVPFQKPVPEAVRAVTIQLAAGLLLANQYGSSYQLAKDKLKDARARLVSRVSIIGADGTSLTVGEGVSGYPTTEEDRAFTIGMRF